MTMSSPSDRRVVSRFPGFTLQPIRLRREMEMLVDAAAVQDFSVAGICFLSKQPLEPGTHVVLEPGTTRQTLLNELKAEVRHTTKLPEDGYLVGCRLLRMLTTDDIMALS